MQNSELTIAIKGAGEMATGIAVALYSAGFKRLVMFDIKAPLAVRRTVSFCEAIWHGQQVVEGITAQKVTNLEEVSAAFAAGQVAVYADQSWSLLPAIAPQVVVDATIAKRNLGTHRGEAALVIGLGPGFEAGVDVHAVVETRRSHNLGRIFYKGSAEANTGEPEAVLGQTHSRVLRAPVAGVVQALREIGEHVHAGDIIMQVGGEPVATQIGGVLRGCIASGLSVPKGCKVGDVDPRNQREYCFTVSDKARSLGGAVLTAVMCWRNS